MARKRCEIRKTQAGTFQARVSYQDGKYNQHKISKTFKLRREAKEWADKKHVELGSGYLQRPRTTESALQEYLDSRQNMQDSTRVQYERTYKKFVKHAKSPQLNEVTISMTSAFLRAMSKPNGKLPSETTKKYAYAYLRAAFKFAVKQGWIDRVPLGEPPRKNQHPLSSDDVLTRSEFRRFVEAARADPETYPMLLLLTTTGIRLGEAFTLERRHIVDGVLYVTKSAKNYDRVHRTIKPSPKSRESWRRIKLVPELEGLLDGPSYLFPFTRKRLVSAITVACKKAGIDKRIKPHGLRHTATTLLLNEGVSIKVLSTILGHLTTSFTLDTYARFMSDNDADVPIAMTKSLEKSDTIQAHEAASSKETAC